MGRSPLTLQTNGIVAVLLLLSNPFLVGVQACGTHEKSCPLLLPTAANSCEKTCTNTLLPCTSNVVCGTLLNLGGCICSTNYFRSWDGSSCVSASGCITTTSTTTSTTTTSTTTTSTTTTKPTTTSTTTTTTPTTTTTSTTTPTTTTTTTPTTTTTSTTTPTTTTSTTTPTTTTIITTPTTTPFACPSFFSLSILAPQVPPVVQVDIGILTVTTVTSPSGFFLTCNCAGINRYGCQIALTTNIYTPTATVAFSSYTVNGDQSPITTSLITCNSDSTYSSVAPVSTDVTSGTGGFFDQILCFGFGLNVCGPLSANHATFLYDPPSAPFYQGAVANLSCTTSPAIIGSTGVTCVNGIWVDETSLQTCI